MINFDFNIVYTNTLYPDGGYTENIYTYYDRVTFPRYITTRTLESGGISSGSYIEKAEYFDGLDRSVKVITDGINEQGQPIEILTATTYDNMGRKDIVYGPYFADESQTSRYFEDIDYDLLGRVTSIRSPKDQSSGLFSYIYYDYPNPFTTVM